MRVTVVDERCTAPIGLSEVPYTSTLDRNVTYRVTTGTGLK